MTRLAWYSPLPPSESGIAQYSAELLPYLVADHAIDAIVADDAPVPAPLPPGIALRRAGSFDAGGAGATRIYQVGNSPEHAPILALAEREPGICVLHDATLQHLQIWRALRDDAAAAEYRAEMARRYGATGERAAHDLLHNRPSAVPYVAIPLCERAVERSTLTIVHSDYARTVVLRHCPGARVVVVPQGVPLLAQGDRRAARARLGLPEEALVVAALGNLIPEKRLGVALRAFARALFAVPEALFIVAGAASAHYDPRAIARARGLEPVTRWLGRVDAATFEEVLVAADLCVNLRWPTSGETSASFLRMLAAGRATIVSDGGSFAETPDDACLKVPVGGEAEEAAIVRAIVLAARDPAAIAAIGTRARAHAAVAHSLEHAAAGYRAAIAAATGGAV